MSEAAEPQLDYLEYYEDFLARVRLLSRKIGESGWMPDFIIGIGRGGRLAISHRAILAGHGDQVDGERILDPLRPDVGLAQRKAQRGGGNGRDKGHGAHPEAKEFRRRLGRARRPRKPENAQTCRVCDKTSR